MCTEERPCINCFTDKGRCENSSVITQEDVERFGRDCSSNGYSPHHPFVQKILSIVSEQNSIIDVHTMAISSLCSDDFDELERILKVLGETRRLNLPNW